MEKYKFDKDYLERPLLDGVKYIITDEKVYIYTEHTSFIQHTKVLKLKQEDLLDLYKKVLNLCRENKIKVHYTNKYKKTILEKWSLYSETYQEYDIDFKTLITMCKKLEKRGIHQGNSDDEFLKKTEQQGYKLNTYFWGGQILFFMRSIYNELDKLYKELENQNIFGYKINEVYL